jgi:hypothetical protein
MMDEIIGRESAQNKLLFSASAMESKGIDISFYLALRFSAGLS